MLRMIVLAAITLVWIANPVRAEVRLTAVTVYATDIDGNINVGERWNTIATHPAWDVWVKDGALPGNTILNETSGTAPDRWIDIPLTNGEHTFSFGVEHFADLCCAGYGLNLFINGSPTAENGEEEPQLTGWTEPDLDLGDDERPTFQAQEPEGTSMGFPLQTFPPAFLDYEGEDFEVELLDFIIYSNQSGWEIDEHSQGSALGPFIPDGNPDVVGQFTVKVTIAGGIAGDFNTNGLLDAADIDDLTGQSASGANNTAYDLNSDAAVNVGDINIWVKDLKNSWIGDANLDGEFNSGDLVVLFIAGTYENPAAPAVWTSGDFNGDGLFTTSDLVSALGDGGYEAGPRAAVAAVPEPASATLLLLGSLVALRRRFRIAA